MSRGIWVNSGGAWQEISALQIGPNNLTAGYVKDSSGNWVKFWPNSQVSLDITLIGGGGAGGGYDAGHPGHPGSSGYRLDGTLSVKTTDAIQVYVGSGGSAGTSGTAGGAGAGGTSGGQFSGGSGGNAGPNGWSGGGGGGGGASAIIVNDVAVVVAAGGGGGGGGGWHSDGRPAQGYADSGATYGGTGQSKGDDGGGGGGGGGGSVLLLDLTAERGSGELGNGL